MGEIFNTILIYPIINLLVAIYQLLIFVHIPFALGFSIILLTIGIRILLYPLTSAQLKASKKMQDIAPHISKLKDKHKGDAKRQQQEMMRLYKEHGVNPAAGCLPTIIQFPILIALYNVLIKIVNLNGNAITDLNKIFYFDFLKLNHVWDQSFFGIPLGKSPSQLLTTMGILVILVPVLTGVLQFIQTKMMMAKKDNTNQIKKEKSGSADFATAFQSQSLYIFPFMIGFFSYSLPMGLSLYWNTLTVFGIIQQYKVQGGLGGLEDWLSKLRSKESVEKITQKGKKK